MSSARAFVLDSLKPHTHRTASLPAPDFAEDPGAWTSAFHYAESIHALLPLLTMIDRAPWREEIPSAAFDECQKRLARERMLLALLDQELSVALERLEGAGIPVVILKGMDLGRRVYPSRALRPMRDADLLVPEPAFDDALGALLAADFRPISSRDPKRFRLELAREGVGAPIELHHRLLVSDSDEFLEEAWARSAEGRIPSLSPKTRALAPEDHFVYLVCHGAVQHLIESPVWLNDVHYLLSARPESSAFDWELALTELERRHALAAAWFVLGFLKDAWSETRIPSGVLDYLEARVDRFRKKRLLPLRRAEVWFAPETRTLPWVARARFLLRDRAWDALRYGLSR